tara:strand:- start:8322 stop:8651 length:330 start_codon:yes stop_codon:yes gene_type:complete
MARVYDNPYWVSSSISDAYYAHNIHPGTGKYNAVYEYTGGQVDFTGSMLGYGPVLIAAPGKATMSLVQGGELYAPNLNTGEIHDLSVIQISGSVADTPKIFVFKGIKIG